MKEKKEKKYRLEPNWSNCFWKFVTADFSRLQEIIGKIWGDLFSYRRKKENPLRKASKIILDSNSFPSFIKSPYIFHKPLIFAYSSIIYLLSSFPCPLVIEIHPPIRDLFENWEINVTIFLKESKVRILVKPTGVFLDLIWIQTLFGLKKGKPR